MAELSKVAVIIAGIGRLAVVGGFQACTTKPSDLLALFYMDTGMLG